MLPWSARERSLRWLGVWILICIALAAIVNANATDFEAIDWNKERQFWSFQPPKAPPLPDVKNRRWPRQDLDFYILEKLEEKRLSPALEADKRTFLRRAAYDITGLPPEQSLANEFLADTRPDSYD